MLKAKDLNSVELTGTTNAAANTSSKFRHNKEQVPFMWNILEGNVYIPRHGASPNDIDVRSVNTSEQFRLLLIFN
jgi:hypothetical protein